MNNTPCITINHQLREYRFWRSSRQMFDEQWTKFIARITQQITDLGFEPLDIRMVEPDRKPEEFHFKLYLNDDEDRLFQEIMCETYSNFDFYPIEGIDYHSWKIK